MKSINTTKIDSIFKYISICLFVLIVSIFQSKAQSPPINDDLCFPKNLNRNLTGIFPYVRTGYVNLNPHSDTIFSNNSNATFFLGEIIEDTGFCGGGTFDNKTLWYTFLAPNCATPNIIISTDDRNTTNFDTRLSVYRRDMPSACWSRYYEIACSNNDSYPGNLGSTTSSTVIINSTDTLPNRNEYVRGENLFVQVSGIDTLSGNFGLIIDVEPNVPITTSIGAGSAVIDWSSVNSLGAITGAYIQWRPVGSGPTVAGTWRYVSGATNTTINGLIPGVNYEFWASYVCTGGGRWWSKKNYFTTNAVCTGGTTPSIVSVVAGSPSCNRPIVSFNAPSIVYSSYKVARRRVGTSTITYSSIYYPSSSTRSWLNGTLVLGASYEFWVVGYCGTTSVVVSPITIYTVCSSLRQANPDATEQTESDKDVVYIMPNGDMVYGLEVNQMPIELDMNNTGEQEITLQTIDASTYFGGDIVSESKIAKVGEVRVFPNPASEEATVSYTLENNESKVELQILDAQGKTMMNEIIMNPEMSGFYNVNLSNYSQGIYFVKIKAGDFIETKKLIVNKN